MRNASGARIAEYLIDGEVASRSTEVAYRATHRVLPRCARVAILNPAFIGVRLAEVQLMREACILEALHHTGVPRAFECGVMERRPWVATEYIEGVSLEQGAAARPLDANDALAIVRDAAAILAHAHHRGVVHRNITPKAIVRTPARGFPLCITEWGNASINDSVIPHIVDPDARFYRAPELAAEGRIDGRADVYALGAVMFEAVTLALPERVPKFPGMPVALHALLARMLTRLPSERPTAAAIHAEASRLTDAYLDGEGTVEQVEVELVDITSASSAAPAAPAAPDVGWLPPPVLSSYQGRALGTMRRRRET
jgi:serine/threonine protein kinase